MTILAEHGAILRGLDRRGRLRSLVKPSGIDFTSNDFLALANDPRLKNAVINALKKGVAVGSGGSRLLRGNHPEHEILESEAAAFFDVERTLYFVTGYMANVALFSTLPQRGDVLVYDALIHASAREGIAASKATSIRVPHNDVNAVDHSIRSWRKNGGKGRPWIAVESIYSMDGDQAPLDDLSEIAERHDGFLVIDEAHATGVLGRGGRGLAAKLVRRENVLTLHTCSKALGVSGGLITGPAILIDYLINRARPYIYSTATSPLLASAICEALSIVREEPERRDELERLVNFTGAEFLKRFGVNPSGSHIQPVIVGDSTRATQIAQILQAQGFDIRAVRPPTVPQGTARFRLSITLNIGQSQIADMFECLAMAMKEHKP
jgi:8-amino-7-oxononanoate synthase